MCPNYRMTNMIMEREGVKAREFVLLVPYLYQQVLKISSYMAISLNTTSSQSIQEVDKSLMRLPDDTMESCSRV
jgi:hypothetical protein